MLITILLLTFLGSIVSLAGGFLLLTQKRWTKTMALKLTSFAAGVLLATAFLDLLPEAQDRIGSGENTVFFSVLAGIIVFFFLERTLFWFHHHHAAHGLQPTVWTITVGDGLHNFIDGVAIAAAFIANPSMGVTTTLAVAAHEIPQELADFSVLLSCGLSKSRTILFNVLSGITALVGAVAMYYFSPLLEASLGSVIAFTAGMFAYIALSDLIPELHHSDSQHESFTQIVLFTVGVTIVFLLTSLFKV